MTKLQHVVYRAYLEDNNVVNDDALLQASVWSKYWNDQKSLYENLKVCPRAESLSRRRRELYNMGLITYSDKKLKERTEAYKNEKDKAGTHFNDMFNMQDQMNELFDLSRKRG